jgi:hypothetical protein
MECYSTHLGDPQPAPPICSALAEKERCALVPVDSESVEYLLGYLGLVAIRFVVCCLPLAGKQRLHFWRVLFLSRISDLGFAKQTSQHFRLDSLVVVDNIRD